MSPTILKQVLSEALLPEPDMATLYYPRDDSLLLALYNKSSPSETADGARSWTAAYRVMPDFENWLQYFSEQVVVQNGNKYQLDEEMVPDSLLDIDDQNIGAISEHTQLLYPTDGSIMKVDTY